MTVNATDFKAKCLQLVERVKQIHEPVLITKRGKVIAQLAPSPAAYDKPWLALARSATIKGDLLAPVLSKRKVNQSLARTTRKIRGLFN